MKCWPASPPSSRRPLRRCPRFGRSFGHIPCRTLFGSPQAQQLGRGLDPAPIYPVPEQIGDPPPNNLRPAGQCAEHSQNRPALLYAGALFVQFWADLCPIRFFLLRLPFVRLPL